MKGNQGFFGSAVVPFRIVFIMWSVFSIEFFYNIDLTFLGILPRDLFGLIGIIFAPLLHGSLQHLISNTVPLLVLGSVLYFFYAPIAPIVFFRSYVITNVLVWLFSPRQHYHIGASGLIYGIASFLIFYGIMRRDFMSLFISIVICLIYGGIFYGILPGDPHISWESHLAGALVGIVTAFNLRNKS